MQYNFQKDKYAKVKEEAARYVALEKKSEDFKKRIMSRYTVGQAIVFLETVNEIKSTAEK